MVEIEEHIATVATTEDPNPDSDTTTESNTEEEGPTETIEEETPIQGVDEERPTQNEQNEHPLIATVRGFLNDEEINYIERDDDEGSKIFFSHLTGNNGTYKIIVKVKPQDSQRVLAICEAPVKVPANRRGLAAEYLMRANYALAIGAFEIDFSDGEVRNRNAVEMNDGILTKEMVRGLVMIPASTMDRFFVGLMQVVYGARPPQNAFEEACNPVSDGGDGNNSGISAAGLMQVLAGLQ